MKKLNEDYQEPSFEDVIELVDDDAFQIGQGYANIPDKKMVCIKCGSDKWIVGQGDWHTAIKCPNCKYEICIHNG